MRSGKAWTYTQHPRLHSPWKHFLFGILHTHGFWLLCYGTSKIDSKTFCFGCLLAWLSLRLRVYPRNGSSLSLYGAGRLGDFFSIVDSVALGSFNKTRARTGRTAELHLTLHPTNKAILAVSGTTLISSALSTMNYVLIGSAMSVSILARARSSVSCSGNMRMGSPSSVGQQIYLITFFTI